MLWRRGVWCWMCIIEGLVQRGRTLDLNSSVTLSKLMKLSVFQVPPGTWRWLRCLPHRFVVTFTWIRLAVSLECSEYTVRAKRLLKKKNHHPHLSSYCYIVKAGFPEEMTLSWAMKDESVVARQQRGQASQAEGTKSPMFQKALCREGVGCVGELNKAGAAAVEWSRGSVVRGKPWETGWGQSK